VNSDAANSATDNQWSISDGWWQRVLRRAATTISPRVLMSAFLSALLITTTQSAWAQTETLLHSFGGYRNDGAGPVAGLAMDAQGNLYGTTTGGGAYGLGTVFKVNSGSSTPETVLYSFTGKSDGSGTTRKRCFTVSQMRKTGCPPILPA
jgi:uncharacterized repeat protein (TIGR03803 family)